MQLNELRIANANAHSEPRFRIKQATNIYKHNRTPKLLAYGIKLIRLASFSGILFPSL